MLEWSKAKEPAQMLTTLSETSPTQRLLVEVFLALGVTFLTLAVPLALKAAGVPQPGRSKGRR
jgi:uncharacterized membrane protein